MIRNVEVCLTFSHFNNFSLYYFWHIFSNLHGGETDLDIIVGKLERWSGDIGQITEDGSGIIVSLSGIIEFLTDHQSTEKLIFSIYISALIIIEYRLKISPLIAYLDGSDPEMLKIMPRYQPKLPSGCDTKRDVKKRIAALIRSSTAILCHFFSLSEIRSNDNLTNLFYEHVIMVQKRLSVEHMDFLRLRDES